MSSPTTMQLDTENTAQSVDISGGDKMLILNVAPNIDVNADIAPTSGNLVRRIPRGATGSRPVLTAKKVVINNRLWAIVDRSGSMGNYFNLVMKSIGHMAETIGVPTVKVFTFDSSSTVTNMTPHDLQTNTMQARGCTYMRRTLEDLVTALNSIDGEFIQLLVISDGNVHDKTNVINYARILDQRIRTDNYIQVVGIRLFTGGSPDTQAITCIFSIGNHPHVTPKLYEMRDSTARSGVCSDPNCNSCGPITTSTGPTVEAQFDEVTRFLKENSTVETHTFIAPDGCLVRRFPWDEPATEIKLVPGMNCILLSGDVDTFASVVVDDKPVTVTVAELESEQDLSVYLTSIESSIRTWKVMGSNEAKVFSAIEFVKKLQIYFNSREYDPVLSPDLRSRIKKLRKEALRKEKSITQIILQLENKSGVDRLNSQQQADFLRELSSDHRSARRIAKRSRFSDVSELENALSESLEKLCNGAASLPSTDANGAGIEDSLPVSFYSVCNNVDVLQMIADERSEISLMSTEDLLQCVGITGLALDVHVANYADPWQVHVKRVYNGCYVGQNDLWCAHQQGASSDGAENPGVLSPPGFGNCAITGVDPMRDTAAPQAYDLYMRSGTYNPVHVSIIMRRVIAPLPDDAIALKTATIYRQIQQLFFPITRTIGTSSSTSAGLLNSGDFNPSEVKVKELIQNIQTLKYQSRFTRTFDNLKEHILKDNFAAYFTGDMDVSNVLKVIGFLLSYDRIGEVDHPSVFRALFSLGLYHKVRKDVHKDLTERQTLRDSVLNINLDAYRTVVQDPFVDEPVDVSIHNSYDLDDMVTKTSKYRKFFHELDNVFKIIVMLHAADFNDIEGITRTINQLAMPEAEYLHLNCDTELYVAAHTVQALQCAEMKHRVDTDSRLVLIQDLTTDVECRTVIADAVRGVYQEDYSKQLSSKKKAEKRILTEQRVADALSTDDMKVFQKIMTEWIPRPNYPGFMEIHDALLIPYSTNSGMNIPMRRAKIWFITLGRNIKGKEIWNSGNVAPDLYTFQSVFEGASSSQDKIYENLTWDNLLKIRTKFCKHTYRLKESNRFGHSNDCPSWWALGYPNVPAYKKAVGNEYFMAYIKARRANRMVLNTDEYTKTGATWSPQNFL